MGRDRAHLSAGALALSLVLLPADAAPAQPVARVAIENATAGPVRLSPGADLIGTAMPALPAEIAPGSRVGPFAIASPFPSAAGGRFAYADAQGRRCAVTISRTRTSLSGPYSWPSARASADRGLACRAEIVEAAPDGGFSVLIRLE